MSRELILIDFSSLAVPIWKMSGKEPDPDAASQKMIERVHALATGQPHVAICMDSGKSFRNELTPTYKANRPESDAPMHHQIGLAADALKADGFPVWKVKGFEADDLIATAVLWASVQPELSVLICSSDKDLLTLVGPTVRQKRLHDDSIYDAAKVLEVCKVTPAQMVDYISLVGDTSDNILGAKGIGAVKAAWILNRFGTLDNCYAELEAKGAAVIGLKPAEGESLRAFKESGAMALARSLVTLRTDVPLPCEEILAERVPKDAPENGDMPPGYEMADDFVEPQRASQDAVTPAVVASAPASAAGSSSNGAPLRTAVNDSVADAAPSRPNGGGSGTSLAVREAEVLPAPVGWERQLEPRSMREAIGVADLMFKSRLFSAYGTPPAVLSAIMSGREIGMPTMASLRVLSGHVIDGKQTFPADLLRALVLKSGKAKYFKCTERTNESATFVTHRIGDDLPVSLTFTIKDGKRAWQKSEDAWLKSGYTKNPADMCVARSSSKLARLVYPDVCAGMYSKEEME